MTNPASDVCGFHFRSLIKSTVFTQQFPWLCDRAFLWAVKLSGSLTVETLKWEYIQMKQWDVWRAPHSAESWVTHLVWPQGVCNCYCSAVLSHTHTHTHWSSFVPNTLWCCLHLSPLDWFCACVNVCVYVHLPFESAFKYFSIYHFRHCNL